MVTILGLWPQGHNPRMVTIIPLSPVYPTNTMTFFRNEVCLVLNGFICIHYIPWSFLFFLRFIMFWSFCYYLCFCRGVLCDYIAICHPCIGLAFCSLSFPYMGWDLIWAPGRDLRFLKNSSKLKKYIFYDEPHFLK